jgi:hypothetical protein
MPTGKVDVNDCTTSANLQGRYQRLHNKCQPARLMSMTAQQMPTCKVDVNDCTANANLQG